MRKRTLSALAAAALVLGGIAGPTAAANAATCNGINAHEWVSYPDPNTGVGVEDIYLDSCKVKALRDNFGNAKDAIALGALLGSSFWPVGVTAGVMYSWAWNNQAQLVGCSANDNGVRIRMWAGLVTGCYGQ